MPDNIYDEIRFVRMQFKAGARGSKARAKMCRTEGDEVGAGMADREAYVQECAVRTVDRAVEWADKLDPDGATSFRARHGVDY